MRLLLDTHIFLWMASEPEALKPGAREIVESTQHELYLSPASAWEIGIKHAIGRLRLPRPPPLYIPDAAQATGVLHLPIVLRHALRVSELPPHHNDPFDRMLIAQAQLEEMAIITADRKIAAYEVEIVAG